MNDSKHSTFASLMKPIVIFIGLYLIHENAQTLTSQFERIGVSSNTELLMKTCAALMWMSAAWLTSRALIALVLNPFSQSRTGQPAPSILVNVVYAGVFVVTGFLTVHFVFGRPIGALMATSGLVTLIIGLAIRDMIADFFSGLAINFERPYSIGDWIELEPGLVARVTELNWRSTRLVTMSERTVIVPNNNFAARQFVNYSLPKRSFRESINITLNYTSDPERIENILESAIKATDGLVKDGNHNVRITSFTERGVVYQIRFWIDDISSQVGLKHKLAGNVLRYLNQAGVPIPYNQTDVLITRDRRARQERRIDVRRLLSRIDWLEPLKASELDLLAEVATPRDFRKGAVIFSEGEEGDMLYLLVEGVASASTGTNGTSEVVGKITPGQAMGEMSLLTGAPRRATVYADTDVHALGIHRDDFEPILRARPEIADELGSVMAQRFQRMEATELNRNKAEGDHDQTSMAKQLAQRISQFFGIGQVH